MDQPNNLHQCILANKYEFLDKLGAGKFGEVWEGRYNQTGETVAIKIEKSSSPLKMLKHETTILNYLHNNGCRQIPSVYWFGLYLTNPVLVMTHYDYSLDQYAKNDIFTLTLSEMNKLAWTMVDLLESIHSQIVIHRDIKPHNFMFKSETKELCLIDFGLATLFMNDQNIHVTEKKDIKSIIGTPKYISVNIHNGSNPSRRDDLISVGYIYLYLAFKSHLPWENLPYQKNTSHEYTENHILHYRNQERRYLKDQVQEYCKLVNTEISEFMKLVYELEYSETPNYTEYKRLFS